MQLFIPLVIILALSGASIIALAAAANTDFARRQRTRVDRPSRIDPAARRRSFIKNAVVSTGLLFVVTLPFQSRLFVRAEMSLWKTIYEAALILMVYDFGYYFLHRFVLHAWPVGRRIHAVHHTVRTPYAKDSLYIHPAETAAGMGLFLASTYAVGPVGVSSFLVAFFIYSLLNVFVHSALDLRSFPFRTLTALVRHHDIHHDSMKGGYYASITPIWDIVFRTTGEPRSGLAGQGTAP